MLATIVEVSGSTYRRPGARMLWLADGETIGLLSGGCLEGDLAERARAVLEAGRATTVAYDMTTQEDLVWGLGLGCAGKVRVLLEPLSDPGPSAWLAIVRDCFERRVHAAVATLFDPGEAGLRTGTRLIVGADGEVRGGLGDAALDRSVLADARAAIAGRAAATRDYPVAGSRARVLLETVSPPLPLVIVGAGADALPLVSLARLLGWHVTVVDHRPAFADPARFPEADAVVECAPAELPQRVALTAETVLVVMTHKFHQDVELLAAVLASPVRYLGVLGPRARTEQLLAELAERGVRPTPEQLARLHAPVGLDIGAEAPEEIALAVVAEIRAALTGRRGGFLRERREPLHDPVL